jgi:hypothetical protein
MMIILATLFDTVLRVMKNILVNGKSKFLASSVNASLYLCNALLIKYIAKTNTIEGLAIIIPISFIGCWIAMSISEHIMKKK